MLRNEEFFELKQMECSEERILEGMSEDTPFGNTAS